MTRFSVALGAAAIAAGAITAGCGGSPEQPANERAPAAEAPASANRSQDLEITFNSTPTPPRTGENTFEVMVKDQSGQPVTDAQVSVEFYMPAMPEMNMAEMRNRADLQHDSGGRYRGAGNVMMAGGWDVTVRVSKDGQEIDTEKLSVTAQ